MLSQTSDIRFELFDCVKSQEWIQPPGNLKVRGGQNGPNRLDEKRKSDQCKATRKFLIILIMVAWRLAVRIVLLTEVPLQQTSPTPATAPD